MTVTIVAAVFGLVIGSFLNVVVYRVPRGLSVVQPGSFCPACGTPIRSSDNVPVVSWLVLRAKCRHCGEPISPRYPAVELLTGALFGAVAWALGAHWAVPGMCALGATALSLAAVELDGLAAPGRGVAHRHGHGRGLARAPRRWPTGGGGTSAACSSAIVAAGCALVAGAWLATTAPWTRASLWALLPAGASWDGSGRSGGRRRGRRSPCLVAVWAVGARARLPKGTTQTNCVPSPWPPPSERARR